MAAPPSLVTFDSNVFDVMIFDTVELTPVIAKIAVPSEMRRVPVGATVVIFVYIYQYETSPGTAIPLNLSTPPDIQVYDPYDFSPVDFQMMTHADDGVYRYQYVVSNAGWSGAYSARVRAVNGQIATISDKAVVFTVA